MYTKSPLTLLNELFVFYFLNPKYIPKSLIKISSGNDYFPAFDANANGVSEIILAQ